MYGGTYSTCEPRGKLPCASGPYSPYVRHGGPWDARVSIARDFGSFLPIASPKSRREMDWSPSTSNSRNWRCVSSTSAGVSEPCSLTKLPSEQSMAVQ